MERTIQIGKHIIPLWLIGTLLLSGIGVGVLANYIWTTVIIPLEVKEPLEILSYPSKLSLYPADTKEFNVTVMNHHSQNYTVILDFFLDNATYQDNYVTFGIETYTVVPYEQNLTAWLKVESYAPPINASLTIDFKRVGEWWNNNWHYRRKVNITGNSGYDLTDFPVELAFDHNGHTQLDGDDIRIIDDGIEIPSCIVAINGTYATVIFEVNITAFSMKSVYVYYGNPSVDSPDYPLVPLTISEGNTGYAIIDNSVYIGWDYTSWGWSNNVELWNDFRIDFNGNNDPTDDNDLIRDYGSRQGGIARHRADIQAIGLGEYQNYLQTPVYIDITFAGAKLRIYRNHPWVETTQADFLHMFSPSYIYAKYRNGTEQNLIDGEGINNPEGFATEVYHLKENPIWMAFRDNSSGYVFASTGMRIGSDYAYHQGGKEATDWDRAIDYCNQTRYDPVEPYDQPAECRIYWYGDDSNNYSKIETMAQILHNQPSILIQKELTGL